MNIDSRQFQTYEHTTVPPLDMESMDGSSVNKVEELKEEVSGILGSLDDPLECLNMIDTLHRLGIYYHFEEQIDAILSSQNWSGGDDLYNASLRFRLLRQLGFFVSPDLFYKFKNKEGGFKPELKKDISGLMSLYEASFLGVQEKVILDEAHEFSNKHLEVLLVSAEPGLAKQIEHTLKHPLHKGLHRFEARHHIETSYRSHEKFRALIDLVVLDFNFSQSMHQIELKETSRWELEGIERLPRYMEKCFLALYNVTNDIGYMIMKKHGWNPIEKLKNSWQILCEAFLIEARWFRSKSMPKADEYLINGITSSGVHIVLVHMFFFMGKGISKETADKLNANTGLIYFPAMMLRLWDDFGTSMDEKHGGYDGSNIECFMKEHSDYASIEVPRSYLMNLITDAWKKLNKEFLETNPFPSSFTKAALKSARMIQIMYQFDDNRRLSNLLDHIKLLLIERVSLQL